jgi:hypothetical protein
MTVAWLAAVVFPFGVAGMLIPLRGVVAEADVALVLAVVILVSATLGGRSTGTATGAAAAVAFDLFFTRPYYSLRIDGAQDIETVLLMLVLGVAIGEIVTQGREGKVAAQLTLSQLARTSRFTELAAGGERPGRLIRVARRELIDLLELEECEFERPPFVDALPRLTHSGLSIPARLGDLAPTQHEERIELPVWADGLEVGRFALTLGPARAALQSPRETRTAALLLADRLGVALRAHDR